MRAAPLVAAALLLAACQQEPVSPPVLKITEHAEAPNSNAGLDSERFIGDGARVEVTGYPDRPRFYALARTPAIEKYPCATCHTMPLERMRNAARVSAECVPLLNMPGGEPSTSRGPSGNTRRLSGGIEI